MRLVRAILSALALLLASTAHAAPKLGYQLELGQSVSIPIADSDYKRIADPSYKASLRFALLIGLPANLHIGPFVELAGVAVNSDDGTFENNGIDARLGRIRFLVGPHLAYRIADRVDVWFRLGLGVDYFWGSVTTTFLNNLRTSNSSTAFALEPSIGATARVWRALTVGGAIGFPFGLSHNFGGNNSFTTADFDITLLVGARL